MPDTDVLRRSVTKDDQPLSLESGVIHIFMADAMTPFNGGLPAHWSRARDVLLRRTPDIEDMWASAVYKAITKQAALGWAVDDQADSQQRIKRAQDLLHSADGTGWVTFVQRHVQDFLTTDNGAFVEVVRASSARGSRILGLMHLDSLRCIRTGDPQRPLIYEDTQGVAHELRDYQVLHFADMPSPSATLNGVGRCAASRAWKTIHKLASVETYFRDKVSGRRHTAIHIVSGVSPKQLKDALATADADASQQGRVAYLGAAIVPLLDAAGTPGVITIPLAEIPDGFDIEQERKDAYLRYANALGVPVQDIQPLSGQGLGTGTQTLILDEAAEGMGLAAWRKQWEHALSFRVLPDATTFTFNSNDIRDQKAKADVALVRAQERAARIASGEISSAEARQLALDSGDLPKELMQQTDATPGGTLFDDEKPLDEQPTNVVPFPAAVPVTKAKDDDVAAWLADEEAAAAKLSREALRA